jgi:hypothetical protein
MIDNGWVWASWIWTKPHKNVVTVAIDVEKGIITKPPPILNKFKGQSVIKLYNWLKPYNLIWVEYKEEL